MLLTVLVGSIFTIVLVGFVVSTFKFRRRQHMLSAKREAAQLQRRADHLFKIALAAQVHTHQNTIARALLEEAVRVLEGAIQLDASAELIANSLRECRALIANLNTEPRPANAETADTTLKLPEPELIEAQMHLTEAMRLIIGFEKRGQISYDALAEMTVALKQAQRAIDLRLQLHQATRALAGDRDVPKRDEVHTGEYLAAAEPSRVQSLR